eukprot:TRINITY_DN9398_c0_g1_i1.p1 TRINITY_DN9398_c0_g1~~TRINITY_DN9398_c0_g1_i1.p1  ORF type:complete len:151 (-),score=26.95 TRINITY_DN9398_c0_g1_i1:395-847(-)
MCHSGQNFSGFLLPLFLLALLPFFLPLKIFGCYFQVAIPVVPTIRVLVTFTKFEELQPLDEFCTPPSSPSYSHPVGRESPAPQPTSSWLQWIKAPYRQSSSMISGPSSRVEDIQDPFIIPPDYTWITLEAKKKKMQENRGKSKKGRGQGH